ncbi:MAG: PfkB family carbohydrate kinase, partial [bacterium]|nr:PfkB family carbohydrate kinase [bacterium]
TFHDGRFQLAIGGKYFVDTLYESVGGGGANVAIGGARNGLKTAVIGKIGNNSFKKLIIDELEEEHVSTSLCDIEENYLNLSSILLTPQGERTVINYQPPHMHIFKSKSAYEKILKTKAVYIGNLPDVALHEKIDITRYAKKNHTHTFMNLGVKDCRRPLAQLEDLVNNVDALIVNGHEFADFSKQNYEKIDFKNSVVEKKISFLNKKILVVTEGAKGSYAYVNGKIFHEKAVKPHVIVDTTGAGDGYTAGFIAGYLKTEDIKLSMEQGSQYASKILAKIGAN